MALNLKLCRTILYICTAIFVIIALILALGVIPSVKAEVARGTTPEKAVIAFWMNAGLNFFLALTLISTANRSKGRCLTTTSVLLIVGFIIMMLGLALADAASAYQSYGPSMHIASVLLFICAAFDFFGGLFVLITAFLIPKKP